MNQTETIRQLSEVEAEIADRQARNQAYITKSLAPLEGKRDRLVLELSDLDGAHDRRVVAVR